MPQPIAIRNIAAAPTIHVTPASISPSHPTTSAAPNMKTPSAHGKTTPETPLNDKPNSQANRQSPTANRQ